MPARLRSLWKRVPIDSCVSISLRHELHLLRRRLLLLARCIDAWPQPASLPSDSCVKKSQTIGFLRRWPLEPRRAIGRLDPQEMRRNCEAGRRHVAQAQISPLRETFGVASPRNFAAHERVATEGRLWLMDVAFKASFAPTGCARICLS
jgi:hypothetical protein